jgi:hypothetical protein
VQCSNDVLHIGPHTYLLKNVRRVLVVSVGKAAVPMCCYCVRMLRKGCIAGQRVKGVVGRPGTFDRIARADPPLSWKPPHPDAAFARCRRCHNCVASRSRRGFAGPVPYQRRSIGDDRQANRSLDFGRGYGSLSWCSGLLQPCHYRHQCDRPMSGCSDDAKRTIAPGYVVIACNIRSTSAHWAMMRQSSSAASNLAVPARNIACESARIILFIICVSHAVAFRTFSREWKHA